MEYSAPAQDWPAKETFIDPPFHPALASYDGSSESDIESTVVAEHRKKRAEKKTANKKMEKSKESSEYSPSVESDNSSSQEELLAESDDSSIEEVAPPSRVAEKQLKVIRPKNVLLKQAMDWRTYRLDGKSGKYTQEMGKILHGCQSRWKFS